MINHGHEFVRPEYMLGYHDTQKTREKDYVEHKDGDGNGVEAVKLVR